MKTRFSLFTLLLLCTLSINAQDSLKGKRVVYREIPVYREVDVMATYRGGYEVVLKQIETATKNCKNGKIKGKDAVIIVDVLVTDKGKVAQIDFVKAPTTLCINDIRKAIENTTQWVPGRIANKPVNSFIQLTINLNNHYNNSNMNAVNRLN